MQGNSKTLIKFKKNYLRNWGLNGETMGAEQLFSFVGNYVHFEMGVRVSNNTQIKKKTPQVGPMGLDIQCLLILYVKLKKKKKKIEMYMLPSFTLHFNKKIKQL